jgi:chromosome segregation ATPase
MSKEKRQFAELEDDIKRAYEESVTIEEAEKLAAKFLGAQIEIARMLREVSLDCRMRKQGLKAIKSAVRTDEIGKHDKKPTEGALDDVVNLSELVSGEEKRYDEAEAAREELERFYGIFHEAHIFFRGISKGRFE